MERLTYDFSIGDNHCWQVKGADNLECREVCERQGDDGCKTCPIAKAFDRLTAYEDTGLEPEEIQVVAGIASENCVKTADAIDKLLQDDAELKSYRELGPIDRLRELAQADREGRCVVLPAGIGDTVHHITTCKNFSQVLDGTMYGPNGELGTATGLYCPCELAETCPFPCDDDGSFDCEKHKNTLAIFEDVVTGILSDDMQDTLFLEYSGNVAFDDFGKTVFLTREEAEAALRREQDG